MAVQRAFSSFGLGLYVNNSPSVCDPVAMFRWVIGLQIGPWIFQWRIK